MYSVFADHFSKMHILTELSCSYSARDEEEVALCIKELNSPSFHPTMISIWVLDSFDRKDMERDLLAELLVNLTKSHGDTLSQPQLIKGYEKIYQFGMY